MRLCRVQRISGDASAERNAQGEYTADQNKAALANHEHNNLNDSPTQELQHKTARGVNPDKQHRDLAGSTQSANSESGFAEAI
jgi:hypothetical protein